MINDFLKEIQKRDVLQVKYLASSLAQLESEEKDMLEKILLFFQKNYCELPDQAEAYLEMVGNIREETKYFLRTGKYRNSSYEEVARAVYFDGNFMERYMLGLVLSDYIWINHVQITRWMKGHMQKTAGERYLEIGPGFGCYFLMAVNYGRFLQYRAVDVSPKSVEGTRKFMESLCGNKMADWKIACSDFWEYQGDNADCIVMGEVLEHVEKPREMLQKIRTLLNAGGVAYISTVINAPAIDHIYLFSSVEEILKMVRECGFLTEDYLCTTENNVSLEKAIMQKRAVTMIMKLLPA